MRSKWCSAVLAIILALSLLPGCSNTSEPDVSSEFDPEMRPVAAETNPDASDSAGSDDTTQQTPDNTASVPSVDSDVNQTTSDTETGAPDAGTTATVTSFSLSDVPAYSGSAYVAVNNNVPYFTDADLTATSFETYNELDALGRCGVAYANVGRDIMPTEERGAIGQVKPTGWHTVKYDCVDGKYLYNRCHLIGYQLSGENANERNLITGTRYLNIEGMLPFENMVADYVRETDNHVLYRVTPIFEGSNLLASGVLMEGLSVEDNGEDICFCVYAYNVQPGVTIDYVTGDSSLAAGTNMVVLEPSIPVTPPQQAEEPTNSNGETAQADYALNTNTMKFHLPSCSSADDIKDSNRQEYHGNRDDLIAQGYVPCKRCNP